ncbi:WRKY DNA-binding protein 57 [Striga asiatica]|uniref:WRKY DNA-binding protein 57 n=1 Tax=Striga asiatica TaxID=4170 RepID=A0A5A7PXJ8_STRAF|nr:WRKY DNA-binding protein 57 [Striga asiatica]
MVSLEKALQSTLNSTTEQPTSPRASFSSDFFDERDFISICPDPMWGLHGSLDELNNSELDMIEFEFEFPSGSRRPSTMMPADELCHQGKMLPFLQPGPKKPGPKPREETAKMSWLPDEGPSPRPPKCTVLWKELLSLKKRRATSAPPDLSLSDAVGKKVIQRRIRPGISVPICSQAKSAAFSPIFRSRKGGFREVR